MNKPRFASHTITVIELIQHIALRPGGKRRGVNFTHALLRTDADFKQKSDINGVKVFNPHYKNVKKWQFLSLISGHNLAKLRAQAMSDAGVEYTPMGPSTNKIQRTGLKHVAKHTENGTMYLGFSPAAYRHLVWYTDATTGEDIEAATLMPFKPAKSHGLYPYITPRLTSVYAVRMGPTSRRRWVRVDHSTLADAMDAMPGILADNGLPEYTSGEPVTA